MQVSPARNKKDKAKRESKSVTPKVATENPNENEKKEDPIPWFQRKNLKNAQPYVDFDKDGKLICTTEN